MRLRGGRRTGENLGAGTFAKLERRGPQGRTDVRVVVSWKGAERGEWQDGPSLNLGWVLGAEGLKAKSVGPKRTQGPGQRLSLNSFPTTPKIADFFKTGSINTAKNV